MPFENPFFIIVLGIVATLVPFLFWCSTGGTRLLVVTMFCVLFFSSWLVVERMVETDRESLQRTIYEFRDLVRQNEIDKLLARVDEVVLPPASADLKRFEFSGCGVSNLSNSPKFSMRDGVKIGEIEFIGSARVENRKPGQVGPVRLKLEFREAGPGDWRVIDYHYCLLGDSQSMWQKNVPY